MGYGSKEYNRGNLMGNDKARTKDASPHHSGAETHPESDSDKGLSDVGGGVMAERAAMRTKGHSSMTKAVRHLEKMHGTKGVYKHKK